MMRIRKLAIILSVIMLFLSFIPVAYATSAAFGIGFEEIELPKDLNFTVNDTCTGHAYFMQATANEEGAFAILSLHVNPNDYRDYDFGKLYIDLYRPDGTFYQELSLETSFGFVIELETDRLNLYFYDWLMVYDLETQELTNYEIPRGDPLFGGMNQLRQRKFTVGDWEYTCKKDMRGYVELNRTDGIQTQTLVKMRGSGEFLVEVILPSSIIGAVISIVAWRIFRKRKTNYKQA